MFYNDFFSLSPSYLFIYYALRFPLVPRKESLASIYPSFSNISPSFLLTQTWAYLVIYKNIAMEKAKSIGPIYAELNYAWCQSLSPHFLFIDPTPPMVICPMFIYPILLFSTIMGIATCYRVSIIEGLSRRTNTLLPTFFFTSPSFFLQREKGDRRRKGGKEEDGQK